MAKLSEEVGEANGMQKIGVYSRSRENLKTIFLATFRAPSHRHYAEMKDVDVSMPYHQKLAETVALRTRTSRFTERGAG